MEMGRMISISLSKPNLRNSSMSIRVTKPLLATWDLKFYATCSTQWTSSEDREEFMIKTSGWWLQSLLIFSHPSICSFQFEDMRRRGRVFASFWGFLNGFEAGGRCTKWLTLSSSENPMLKVVWRAIAFALPYVILLCVVGLLTPHHWIWPSRSVLIERPPESILLLTELYSLWDG